MSERLTPEALDELDRLETAATPGPSAIANYAPPPPAPDPTCHHCGGSAPKDGGPCCRWAPAPDRREAEACARCDGRASFQPEPTQPHIVLRCPECNGTGKKGGNHD